MFAKQTTFRNLMLFQQILMSCYFATNSLKQFISLSLFQAIKEASCVCVLNAFNSKFSRAPID